MKRKNILKIRRILTVFLLISLCLVGAATADDSDSTTDDANAPAHIGFRIPGETIVHSTAFGNEDLNSVYWYDGITGLIPIDIGSYTASNYTLTIKSDLTPGRYFSQIGGGSGYYMTIYQNRITISNGSTKITDAYVNDNGISFNVIYYPTGNDGEYIEGFYTDTNFSTKVASFDGRLEKNVTNFTDSEGKWIGGKDKTIYPKWEVGVVAVIGGTEYKTVSDLKNFIDTQAENTQITDTLHNITGTIVTESSVKVVKSEGKKIVWLELVDSKNSTVKVFGGAGSACKFYDIINTYGENSILCMPKGNFVCETTITISKPMTVIGAVSDGKPQTKMVKGEYGISKNNHLLNCAFRGTEYKSSIGTVLIKNLELASGSLSSPNAAVQAIGNCDITIENLYIHDFIWGALSVNAANSVDSSYANAKSATINCKGVTTDGNLVTVSMFPLPREEAKTVESTAYFNYDKNCKFNDTALYAIESVSKRIPGYGNSIINGYSILEYELIGTDGTVFKGFYQADPTDSGKIKEGYVAIEKTKGELHGWEIQVQNIFVEHVDHTTADGSASTLSADAGQEVTLTKPTCEDGYECTGWTSDQVTVTADKFTMPDPVVNVTVTPILIQNDYTVTIPGGSYKFGNAPESPIISPEPPTGSVVVFYMTSGTSGSGTEWSVTEANKLETGTYYVYATVDGKETKRSSFEVEKATQASPSSNFTITSSKQPITVTIPEVDKNKLLEYSTNGGETWTTITLDQNNEFTLTGLEQNTTYTLSIRVQGTKNYYPSSAVSRSFTTPDETPMISLTYNANGGSNAPDRVEVKKGSNVTINSGYYVEKSGYAFDGWYTDPKQGSEVSGTIVLNEDMTLYAHWSPTMYTVIFRANGGSGSMPNQVLMTDVQTALNENIFTAPSGSEFAGWSLTSTGPVAYTNGQIVSNIASGDSVTLYAVWLDEPTYGISGSITGNPGSNVTLKLMYGNSEIDTTTCEIGSGGSENYSFSKEVPNGTYNVVATDGNNTVTKLVVINGKSESASIKISDVNSVIEVKEANQTPAVVAGGLDEEAENHIVKGEKVTITLTVESKVKVDVAGDDTEAQKEKEVQNSIKKIEEDPIVEGKEIEYISMTVTKKVNEENPESISKTTTVLEMVIPYDFTNKENIIVTRYHGDKVQAFEELESKPETRYNDGTFYCDTTNSKIYVYADSFSVYAIAYNEKDNPEPPVPPVSKSTSSTSSVSFTGTKSGNNFVFNNAVVVTKATLPGASNAKITNNGSGDGWYKFTLTTDGFSGNGTLYFQVPLDVIEVKGYTVNDVSLFGSTTTYLGTDGQYAKYSAPVTKDGTYTIGFEEGAAESKSVTPQTPVTDECKLSIDGVSSMKAGTTTTLKVVCNDGHIHTYQWSVNDSSIATIDANGNLKALKAGTVTVTVKDDDGHSATKTITVTNSTETPQTKSPFPILGILAGIGVAGIFLKLRRN